MEPPVKKFIVTNLKIINRYTSLGGLFFVSIIVCVLFGVLLGRLSWVDLNAPVLATTINFMLWSFLFENLFIGGVQEEVLHLIAPVDFNKVIFAKNVSVLIVVSLLFCCTVVFITVVFKSNFDAIADAVIYFLIGTFTALNLGNYIAVRFKQIGASNNIIIFSIIHTGLIVVASLPYLMLKVFLQSYLLCLLFTALLFCCWRFFTIPFAARMLRACKFEIIEE
jgi:hypothetical protein